MAIPLYNQTDNSSINETQQNGYECLFSFNFNMQLPVTLQNGNEVTNGNEVNRETLPP